MDDECVMACSTVAHGATAGRARRVLPRGVALASGAVAFTTVYSAAGALMPLLVVYQKRWDLTPTVLTAVFAVFAVGFLTAVLAIGSLSDHIGRRPVLLGALLAHLVSTVAFLAAPTIDWVIAGRVVQGFATGAATTAFTAALAEVAPPNRAKLGVALGSVCLSGGLALGSLAAGLIIQFTASPNTVVFVGLGVATCFGVITIIYFPEGIARTPHLRHPFLSPIAVPAAARREFTAAAPVVVAIWMLSALSGGLAPALVRSFFHVDSGLMNGVSGCIGPAVSAVVGIMVTRQDPRRSMIGGIALSVIGASVIAGSLGAEWLPAMIMGQAIGGAGFGASFTAFLRLTAPLVAPRQRAGLATATYVLSYSAFGLPLIAAGVLTDRLGMVSTVWSYAGATVLLALVGLQMQVRISRGR
jgi:MFS family permease